MCQSLRWRIWWGVLGTCLAVSCSAARAAGNLERHEFLQIRMAVPVKIVVYAPDSTVAIQASNAAYERIRQLDRIMSDYDPDSELMKLCSQSHVGEPVAVSEDLLRVLVAAKELSRATAGAFDVTVGPVVKLWRVARRKKVLPDKSTLSAALRSVGDGLLTVDQDHRTVTLARAGMQLDLGGIAKGYAADEALRVLKSHGLPNSLVAVAGDIRVGDAPPGMTGWRVEIEDYSQSPEQERPQLILLLENKAISTSGDTYQFLEIKGVRYSHLLDPKTGIGLTTPRSVTVVAPTGMQADALASAVSVLGPEAGVKLLESVEGAGAFIVELGADGMRRKIKTPGWASLPRRQPQGN